MKEPRLRLPQVTLVAIASVNIAATVRALQASLAEVEFAACKLLTHAPPAALPAGIDIVPIARIGSSAAYSRFVLSHLADHVDTDFCLVCQWDGYVLNPGLWRPEFLDYDYIGASWPQFDAGRDVGNGGFSLRSRRLLDLCAQPGFAPSHPEDLAICHRNRDWLDRHGIAFAPRALADRFSCERRGTPDGTFGFHGVWHMPDVLGAPKFCDTCRELDDRSTVWHDFPFLLRQIARGSGGLGRSLDFIRQRTLDALHAGRP